MCLSRVLDRWNNRWNWRVPAERAVGFERAQGYNEQNYEANDKKNHNLMVDNLIINN